VGGANDEENCLHDVLRASSHTVGVLGKPAVLLVQDYISDESLADVIVFMKEGLLSVFYTDCKILR